MEVQNINAINPEHRAMLISALAGDMEALGQLLSGLADQLYWAAFRVLGSHEEAEDAVQEGPLGALKTRPRGPTVLALV